MKTTKRNLLTTMLVMSLVLALGVTAIAVRRLRNQKSARTDQAQATLVGERRISVRQTVCRGEDGEYREAVEVFEGTATSPDPRLSGTLTVTISSFINRSPDQQEGTVEGKIEIRNALGGKVKARFNAVSDDAQTLEGTLVGRINAPGDDADRNDNDDDDGGGERLFANFFGNFNAMDDERDFRVTLGQEPPTDSARNSAVIQRGKCQRGSSGMKED
jgi:hypothetical protein